MSTRRIAVMVDGDNISAKHSPRILSEARALGRPDIVRVYAAVDRHSDWLAVTGYRLLHAGSGKNAADLLLCIDAMELALTGEVEAFIIATSDGDFTHLAQRLRERGLDVIGLGEDKAPEGFRASCTEFRPLANGTAPKAGPATHVSAFDKKIRDMIAHHSKNGCGMRIADLSPRMYAEHGTRISAHPERNWRTYLSARPKLYDIDPRGPDAMVRFRPEGFSYH